MTASDTMNTDKENQAGQNPSRPHEAVSLAMPICDIVVLTMDQLLVLKPCIESVMKYTKLPVRLVVVNNGGGVRIRRYLESLKPSKNITFLFHHFDENQGFVGGNNHAVKDGTSPYVCLLNNDCVVTPGWLEGMIEAMESDPKVAAVNPQSSTMTSSDAKNVHPNEIAKQCALRRGEYYTMGSAVGFCMLIRRSVIDQIGLFDPEIDTAYFEDADFSYRVKEAGYRCIQTAGVYVHHEPYGTSGSISIKRREELFNKNRRWFERKWGKRLRILVAYDLVKHGPEPLKELLGSIREVLLRDNHVELIIRVREPFTGSADDFLKMHGFSLTQFPNLKLVLRSTSFFSFMVWRRLAMKLRKRFDVALSNETRLLTPLITLKPFLGVWLAWIELSGCAAVRTPLFLDRVYVLNPPAKGKIIRPVRDLFDIRKDKMGRL